LDFDTPSPKMLYEVNVNGELRKVVANFSERLPLHARPRQRAVLRADQYQEKIT
jgi:hypothetical protein